MSSARSRVRGVGEGLSTITDGNGTYALYGLRDRVRLQANGAGYLNRLEEIEVDGHRTFDFQISRNASGPTGGRYTLTFDRGSCVQLDSCQRPAPTTPPSRRMVRGSRSRSPAPISWSPPAAATRSAASPTQETA